MKTLSSNYLQEVFGIFSCAVFCVYSWSMLIFFWDLPSFLFYLSAGDIIGYLAYQFTFALGESILVTISITAFITAIITVFTVVFRFILPTKRFRNDFSVTGSLLVFFFVIISLIFKEFQGLQGIAKWLMQTFLIDSFHATAISVGIWICTMPALPILSFGLANQKKISHFIRNFIGNLYVLVLLYISLSVPSIAIVIYRNIP
jgi:hypothetical protein